MKSKIFARLKQEYSSLGLGDEALMSRAEALAATGLVTDDNVDAVVAVQRSDLEGLQSRTDKRVTDALEKERKKHEEETRRKEEEAKAKAEEERRKAEEAKRKQEGEGQQKGNGDDPRFSEFERRLAEMTANSTKKDEEYAAIIKALTESKEKLEEQVKGLTDENNAAKAAQAKAAHDKMVLDKAKALGIPQWRIDEGFPIADDATEQSIEETLTKVSNNISANLLPGNHGFSPLGDSEPSADEIAGLAAAIVK